MAISFTQEQTTAICGGVNQDCANGGTAGTTPVSVSVASSASNSVVVQFVMQPGTTTWQAGSYTLNLDVTTANTKLTITGGLLIQRSSSCTSIATLATATFSQSLSATGVFPLTITLASDTAVSSTDVLQWNLEVSNSAMSSQSFSFTPDKTVDTPITSGPASLTITGSDTVAAFSSSGSAVAGRIITATDTVADFTSSGTITLPTWVLSGSDTISAFTSSASLVAGRIISAADTVGAFVSSGSASVVGQKTISGADTIAAFVSSASVVAGRSITGADTVAAFVSSGSVAFLVSLSAADAVAAFTSSASAVAGRSISGSDTVAAFVSSGSGTVTASGSETLSGTDTIAPFVSFGTLTLEATAPVPAGRHHWKRGKKRFGVEIDGRLIVADTRKELEKKYAAYRKAHPAEFVPEAPIIVPVPPEEPKITYVAPKPKKAALSPLPESIIDFNLARRAIEARIHIQDALMEQERRKREQKFLDEEDEQIAIWLAVSA